MDQLRYFLRFEDLPIIEREIFEPYGSDASSFTIEQQSESFGRDVYVYNEDTNLEFTNGYFEIGTPYLDLSGELVKHLSHQLDLIFQRFTLYGADANIRLIIKKNNLEFHSGMLDLENAETDRTTFLKCKTIDVSKRSLHKIRGDVKVDLFANKDLNNNQVVPLQPIKMLIKSKSVEKVSEFYADYIIDTEFTAISAFPEYNFMFNPCEKIIRNGILTTISPTNNFVLINASKNYRNVQIDITNFSLYASGDTDNGASGKADISLVIEYNGIVQTLLYVPIDCDDNEIVNIIQDFSLFIPILPQGGIIRLYFIGKVRITDDVTFGNMRAQLYVKTSNFTTKITATETFINSVVSGVRWGDAVKRSSLLTSGLNVNIPRWQFGGKYYNTLAINGYGIRNIDGKPFATTTDAMYASLLMVAGFSQITETNIEVGIYNDFYGNVEIGKFQTIPSESFSFGVNQRNRINIFNYKFKKYEQDRQEKETIDAVHTESQWLLPSIKSKNNKDVEIEPILDPYEIEKARRLGLDPNTKETSLENDDELYLIDFVELEPNHKEEYEGVFTMQIINGNLAIYSDQFSWLKVGLTIGQNFEIIAGNNVGMYVINAIEINRIILTGAPSNGGDLYIKFKYELVGVNYKNRTSEGFTSISGIFEPENFANILYSIKRNMDNWLPYLATCAINQPLGIIKNAFFKNNGNLVSRFGIDPLYVDKKDILVSEISNLKRVTDRTFKATFYANFEDVKLLIDKSNKRNNDGSIGGYVSLFDINGFEIKGYILTLTYLWQEGSFEGEFEEKYN